MKHFFLEGNDESMVELFVSEGYVRVDDLGQADILVLEGGADVDPARYGEENTHSYSSLSKDLISFGLIEQAEEMKIPVVGVCRGSQVMCVHNGGSMVQDISGHAIYGTHDLVYEGKTYQVSSAHHQEAVPDLPEEFVWRAPDGTVEMHVYPESKQVGVQFHPEYLPVGHECRQLFFQMIDKYCF